jgi:hypothetical protein
VNRIPAVTSPEEIPDAIRYASANPSARWFVSRRVALLGHADEVPTEWGAAITAGLQVDSPSDVASMTDATLLGLAAQALSAFQAADVADNLDEMQAAADQLDEIKPELARRGLQMPGPDDEPDEVVADVAQPDTTVLDASKRNPSRKLRTPSLSDARQALSAGAATLTRPPVAADRRPQGNRGGGPNTVLSAGGELPGWESQVQRVTAKDFPAVDRREATARADAENASRVAAAREADRVMRDQADAVGLAMARVDPAAVLWAPYAWLVQAAQANPDAPAWAVSCWSNALASPHASIAPLDWEFLQLQAAVSQPFGTSRTDWRLAHNLVTDLTEGRPNVTPNPQWAVRAPWRSPETSWTATGGQGLLEALYVLQGDAHDPTCVVRDNQLRGDSPYARLASLIVGPQADTRIPPGGIRDTTLLGYGAGSVMEQVASNLRGGAPAPVDRSALDSLTVAQRRALAALATQDEPQ